MRTTLNLEEDVLDQARDLAERRGATFREIVNEALRAGLGVLETPVVVRPYRTAAREMGLLPGRSLDNVNDLLDTLEAEER